MIVFFLFFFFFYYSILSFSNLSGVWVGNHQCLIKSTLDFNFLEPQINNKIIYKYMDLLATTTVVQQYPISPSFISTFKFYNIIFFIFPTCNFNLKSSLFYSYFSFFGPLFSLSLPFFFPTSFLLRATLSVLLFPKILKNMPKYKI